MVHPIIDFDSPWKDMIELYFEQFLQFFFPEAHAGIDWRKGYQFLDKELRKLVRESEVGRRLVDKLVKVWRNDGQEIWVLVHIEIQNQMEPHFAKRMFVYHYRIFDRYDRQVVSLAILTDENTTWRPAHFGYDLWQCRLDLDFPIVKLLDYRENWQALETNLNVFAIVAMAHLKALETRHDEEKQFEAKYYLIRRLYERGHAKEQIQELFRFIDWLMQLPPELEEKLTIEISRLKEEKKLKYISSIERKGIEQGIEKGIEQGIEKGIEQGIEKGITQGIELTLENKFGVEALKELPLIQKIKNVETLRSILKIAISAQSLEEFRQIIRPLTLQNN
jgi:hypothetical protein